MSGERRWVGRKVRELVKVGSQRGREVRTAVAPGDGRWDAGHRNEVVRALDEQVGIRRLLVECRIGDGVPEVRVEPREVSLVDGDGEKEFVEARLGEVRLA